MAVLALLAALALLAPAPVTAQASYGPCEGLAAADVGEAFTLIQRNARRISTVWIREQLPRIKDDARRGLLLRHGRAVKKAFDRTWHPGGVRIVCTPCPESGLMGQSLGSRTVLVCYDHHVALRTGFCELVDTVVHEAVHQIDLPTGSGHTHSNAAERADDPIYRFGWAAGELCRASGWERPLAGSAVGVGGG